MKFDSDNDEFLTAYRLVNSTNENTFITGKAGTGKTTFLKYLKENSNKNIIVLAYTSLASINAGGQTLNSFFQIPFGPIIPNDKRLRRKAPKDDQDKKTIFDNFKYNNDKIELIKAIETIIIDEISTVRADLLDTIDSLLRAIRKNEKEPFGGVQMIFIGDLFQLPPIAEFEQWQILNEYYETPYFFSSKIIKYIKLSKIELLKNYRQKDKYFIDLLDKIRQSTINEYELNKINK